MKMKSLIILALLFFTASAQGKTRILVYNNTLQTLNFDLRQSNTPLASRHWSQGVASISPTKAEEILAIKKNGGIQNNTTYGFEIDVSDGLSTAVFKIRIEGQAVGRQISQAVNNGQFFSDSSLRTARWGQRNVRYRQESNGDFIFVIADQSRRLLRFPVQDRTLIDESNSAANPLAGPLSPDMRTGDRNRGIGINCLAFNGKKNPPHCYSGHRGTDYMLKGGFRQMDRPGNYVVAARAGTVVAVRQNLYDRCKAKLYSGDERSLLQPDCNGNNYHEDDEDQEYLIGNRVVVDHGDGLYTEYYHLKTNSALVEVGDEVSCGQPLASIGSSGFSTKPHLHFEVLECREGETCDRYNDRDIIAVNPYNGTYTGRGYWVEQGSGRLPSSQCAVGQPVYQGPVAPPARGCTDDVDCGPGNYCNKRIGENRCLAEGSFDVGAACYKNRECASGKCQGRGDNRMCVCNADSDCGNGQYCNKRLGQNQCLADASKSLGQSCSTNNECASGKCQGAGNARMCVCNVDNDCGNGQYCNKRLGQNRCLADASKSLGQSCSTNNECASGKCQGAGNARMCVCNVDSDCSSGQYCNNRLGQNRCLADGNKSIGQSCLKNSECSTNKCEQNMCVCRRDSDCPGSQKCKTPIARKNYCD